LSQQLDGLLGMLCVDVAPADGASIQQTLKLLEEKLKSVGKQILKMLKHKGSFFKNIITMVRQVNFY
jgi:hypothetical protein